MGRRGGQFSLAMLLDVKKGWFCEFFYTSGVFFFCFVLGATFGEFGGLLSLPRDALSQVSLWDITPNCEKLIDK